VTRLAALAAAVLLCGAAGCGGGGGAGGAGPDGTSARGTSAPEPASPEGQLTALLQRRAKALQAGDARRLAATATGAQRARDRAEARNARGLPLRDVTLEARDTEVRDAGAVLEVRAGYGISGIRGRFEAERILRARRTAKGWRIASSTSRRARLPWEVARYGAHRTSHFTILAPAALATDGLDDALEGGYVRMRDLLVKGILRRRYLVVVAGSAADARRMTTGIRGVATLAAISDSAVREKGPADRVIQVASQRLLVVWPPFASLDSEGRARVITHELTHAALAGHTSGRTPGWLLEGIALYVSGDRRVGAAARFVAGDAGRVSRRALTLTGLSEPGAIGRLGGEGQSAAYAYSSAAAFYIAERYGRKRFLRLYDAFNDPELSEPEGPELTAAAVQRTLGVPLLQLERDLRRWIVTRAVVEPFAP
jgi:hypothetical protein